MMKKRLFRWLEAFSVAGLLAFLLAGSSAAASEQHAGRIQAGGWTGQRRWSSASSTSDPRKITATTRPMQRRRGRQEDARRQGCWRKRRSPEDDDVQKTMKNMIEDEGAKVIFATSFGYFDPHVLQVAKEYPKVSSCTAAACRTKAKHPKNVGSYFGYIDECAIHLRHRRRPHDQDEQARLRGRQADSAGAAATSTPSAAVRAASIPRPGAT